MSGSHALITASQISRNREPVITCPECDWTTPRRYKGTLRVGPTYLTGMRLSGYRKLSIHIEEEHFDEADDAE